MKKLEGKYICLVDKNGEKIYTGDDVKIVYTFDEGSCSEIIYSGRVIESEYGYKLKSVEVDTGLCSIDDLEYMEENNLELSESGIYLECFNPRDIEKIKE